MTNTLNTPAESLEYHYPLRLTQFAIRRGSGGLGLHAGGEGVIREIEFLEETQVSLLTERRRFAPWGIGGGGDGEVGSNWLNGEKIAAKADIFAFAGDRLLIETPGGGGWGAALD
jgi:N-methylhydantoinase B